MSRALAINALRYTLIVIGVSLVAYGMAARQYLLIAAGAFVVLRSASTGS